MAHFFLRAGSAGRRAAFVAAAASGKQGREGGGLDLLMWKKKSGVCPLVVRALFHSHSFHPDVHTGSAVLLGGGGMAYETLCKEEQQVRFG